MKYHYDIGTTSEEAIKIEEDKLLKKYGYTREELDKESLKGLRCIALDQALKNQMKDFETACNEYKKVKGVK